MGTIGAGMAARGHYILICFYFFSVCLYSIIFHARPHELPAWNRPFYIDLLSKQLGGQGCDLTTVVSTVQGMGWAYLLLWPSGRPIICVFLHSCGLWDTRAWFLGTTRNKKEKKEKNTLHNTQAQHTSFVTVYGDILPNCWTLFVERCWKFMKETCSQMQTTQLLKKPEC